MSSPDRLLDTSAAIALVLASHEHHEETVDHLDGLRLGLAGHAWFETFSVITRMPAPTRRSPEVVAQILAQNFPDSCFLSEERTRELTATIGESGLAGGAVYDALVGAAAAERTIPLVTRDRRAIDTYRLVGAAFELIST